MKKYFAYLLLLSSAISNAQVMEFSWPAACQLGEDCFAFPAGKNIQISFIPQENHQTVSVVAAASGQVVYVEDQKEEALPSGLFSESKDCGNGVIIQHSQGWQTQYCHLKKNSVVVHSGQQIKAGKVIGKVSLTSQQGLFGLLFSVKQEGQEKDPFTEKLWQDKTIAYQEVGLMDIGMHDKILDLNTLMIDPPHKKSFTRADEAFVVWVRTLNLKQGDLQKFTFYSPDGHIYRDDIQFPVAQDKSDFITMTGYPLKNKNIPEAYNGEWRMVYALKRGEQNWEALGEVRFILEN